MSLLFNMLSRLVIKMMPNLENKMKLQINRLEMRIEKMPEIFDKDLEEIKKSQLIMNNAISSVQLLSVSGSLRPHGLKHARPPCPSPTPRVYSNSCPLSRWCHPTISSHPFSSHLQSLPASGSFPVSQFFASGGQSVGASASVLPMNVQYWFPLELTGWISL